MTEAAVHHGFEPEHERGAFMSLYSGGKFYPLDPHPEDVTVVDIAHALSQQNRFNGHVRWPYSVAQHSVHVLSAVKRMFPEADKELLLFALFHDAAEAYIGDVITPVKHYLPFFKEIEDKIMKAVSDKFGFRMTKHRKKKIKQADLLMCSAEKRDLHPTEIEWPNMPDPSPVRTIIPWAPSYAKGRFMREYNELQRMD